MEIFCIPQYGRIIALTNQDLFLIYSIIFVVINVFIIFYSKNLNLKKINKNNLPLFLAMACQIFIGIMLFSIYGQIKTTSFYYKSFLYLIIYASLGTSIFFLLIGVIQFLRWYIRSKNYLVLIYGLIMLVLVANTSIGIIYLSQVSLSQSKIIRHTSCRAMLASLFNVNPELNFKLSNMYDITSILSFVLAWLASASMLKQYVKGKFKPGFWILVILPLIFFLTRYEVGLYYFLSDQAVDILGTINLSSDIYGYAFIQLVFNSNLQLGGIFFGIAFFTIAFRLRTRHQLRRYLIITGIGFMFLFSSKDISTLIISSLPPLAAVSIAFVGMASYLISVGIYNTAKLTSRDVSTRKSLLEKIENNSDLLRSIALSQNQMDTEKAVKDIMKLTAERDVEEETPMSQEEIKQIVNDVISEIKASKIPKKY